MKYIKDISEDTYGVFLDNRNSVLLGALWECPATYWSLSRYDKWLNEVGYGFINLTDPSSIPIMVTHKNIVEFYTIGQSISKLLSKYYTILLKDEEAITKCSNDKEYLQDQVSMMYISTSIFYKVYSKTYYGFNFWEFLKKLVDNEINTFIGVSKMLDEYIVYLAFDGKLKEIADN